LHFGELAKEYLAAQGNAVSSTFASLASLGMGRCELSAQDMPNLVRLIESSPKLRTLAFDYTTLPQAGFDALATAFPSVPLLHTLSLKNVMADNWDLGALASQLSQLSQLSSINIHGCHMQPAHACPLFEAMHGLTRMETLALGSNKLGSLGAQALARALQNLPEIRNLYCASASLCAGDVRDIFFAIRTRNLRRLELNNNTIGGRGG
jgi:Ran GTPase-activating protein (RanGAP) involved in mRNA processing and transport